MIDIEKLRRKVSGPLNRAAWQRWIFAEGGKPRPQAVIASVLIAVLVSVYDPTVASALASVAVAFLTLTLAGNSSGELNQLREVERAYLTGGGDLEASGTIFRVEVSNYGKTPAFLCAYEVRFAESQEEVSKPRETPCEWDYFDERVSPGGQRDVRVVGSKPVPRGAKIIYGSFRYTDIWKEEHRFCFCLEIKNQRTFPSLVGVHEDFRRWD